MGRLTILEDRFEELSNTLEELREELREFVSPQLVSLDIPYTISGKYIDIRIQDLVDYPGFIEDYDTCYHETNIMMSIGNRSVYREHRREMGVSTASLRTISNALNTIPEDIVRFEKNLF